MTYIGNNQRVETRDLREDLVASLDGTLQRAAPKLVCLRQGLAIGRVPEADGKVDLRLSSRGKIGILPRKFRVFVLSGGRALFDLC